MLLLFSFLLFIASVIIIHLCYQRGYVHGSLTGLYNMWKERCVIDNACLGRFMEQFMLKTLFRFHNSYYSVESNDIRVCACNEYGVSVRNIDLHIEVGKDADEDEMKAD